MAEAAGGDAPGPWGGRGWLAALVAMTGALLLMLPVAWAYVATRMRREMDASVVTTIVLLPIAVAAILVIVQDSLAVAFSLAGIAGLVRFRNALDDTRDAMYVVIAIAVGLGARVGTLEASAALTASTTSRSSPSGSGTPRSLSSPTSRWANRPCPRVRPFLRP